MEPHEMTDFANRMARFHKSRVELDEGVQEMMERMDQQQDIMAWPLIDTPTRIPVN